jgi:hypothetical protein
MSNMFLSLHSRPPNHGTKPPTTCSTTATPPLQHPFYQGCQLSVDCCVLLLNSSHLRAPKVNSPSHLYFSLVSVWHPKPGNPATVSTKLTVRTLYRPMGSHGAMSWGHHSLTHGERGQSRWRVGQWWFTLVVVCFGCGFDCGLR